MKVRTLILLFAALLVVAALVGAAFIFHLLHLIAIND